jgi:cytochrome bd-type quinol oxidase subunit 2
MDDGKPTMTRQGERTRRRTAFRVISIVMAVSGLAFGLFTVVFGLIDKNQKIHSVHNVVVGSLLIVLSAPAAIAAARSPEHSRRPLVHLAAVGIAGIVTMAMSFTLDPFTLPFVLLVGVLWALRQSRDPALPQGRPSPILLVLILAAAIPLAVYAWGQAELQRVDEFSEHDQFFHWVETSFYAVAVLLLGLLASLRPAAYRLSGWSAAAALAILAGASLVFTDYPSALDSSWAWAALAGSLVFLSVLEGESRRKTLHDASASRRHPAS